MNFNPKWVIGKIIARVELNSWDNGRGSKAHAPEILFTDGSSITFSTEETEGSDYGTSIYYHKVGA